MKAIPVLSLLVGVLLGGCAQYAYVPATVAYPGYPVPDVAYNRPVYQTPVGVITNTVAYPVAQPVVMVPVRTYWGYRPYRPWDYPQVRYEVCC